MHPLVDFVLLSTRVQRIACNCGSVNHIYSMNFQFNYSTYSASVYRSSFLTSFLRFRSLYEFCKNDPIQTVSVIFSSSSFIKMSAVLRNRTDGRLEQVVAPEAVNSLVISWVLYGVEGGILTVTNFPIVLTVCIYSKLRQQKEFVIIGALALADGIAGFGFLLAAIGRITAVEDGTGKQALICISL